MEEKERFAGEASMFGRLIAFESFAIVREITRRILVSANLTSEGECRERERERKKRPSMSRKHLAFPYSTNDVVR